MPETLTAIPAALTAGDSAIWLLSDADHPAGSGWGLTFTFRSNGNPGIQFASTASGDDHLISLTPDTTAGWADGEYWGSARASDGTNSDTVWSGWLRVKPDLSQKPDNYDARSSAQKCLDAINSVLEGKASRDAISTNIAGQSIVRMSFDELLRAKAQFEAIVAQEKAQLAVDNGQGSGNHILVRFARA